MRWAIYIGTWSALIVALGCSTQVGADPTGVSQDNLSSGIDGTVFGTGGAGLNVRTSPNSSGSIITTLADGAEVWITCQTSGESVGGDAIWDYIGSLGGYVSDAYVWTGYDDFAPGVPRCDDSGGSGGQSIWGTDGDGVNVRSAPSTSGSIIEWLAEGTPVDVTCQTTGTYVVGTDIWDYIGAIGGYVTDAYVYTGYDGFSPDIPRCDGGSSSSLGEDAVAEARTYLGYEASPEGCNMFSDALGNGCVEWCSDFVRYVWGQVGANTSGLTAYSGTFLDYGDAHGTFHSYPTPGDAVLWCGGGGEPYCKHVGMVTEVSGGTFRVINGNWHTYGDARSWVYETGYIDMSYDAGTGAPIVGFVSPVP